MFQDFVGKLWAMIVWGENCLEKGIEGVLSDYGNVLYLGWSFIDHENPLKYVYFFVWEYLLHSKKELP